jgi:transposase
MKAKVLEFVRTGYTAKKISETTGVPQSTARGWADEDGLRVKSSPKGYSPEMKVKVLELVRAGYTAKKISETTGVPQSTVRGWADEAGLRPMQQRRKRTNLALAQEDAPLAHNESVPKAALESTEGKSESGNFIYT